MHYEKECIRTLSANEIIIETRCHNVFQECLEIVYMA